MFNEKIPNTPSPEKGREESAEENNTEDKLLPILEGESLPQQVQDELGVPPENILPQETREWLEDLYVTEKESASNVLKRAISILEKRNKVHRTFPESREEECFYEEQFEGEAEKTKAKMREIIEEGLANKMETVGTGKTAKVVSSTTDADCCYKIINNIDHYRKGNDVKQESEFLDRLADLEDTNTRVPRPYCYEKQKEGHLYVMEKLNAFTLEEIKLGKVDIPESFDLNSFFNDLKKFIKKMHEQGIYHRDLANAENIMVDKNEGNPYIIDFGLATESHMDSEDPYQNRKYYDDIKSVEEHHRQLQQVFKKQQN